MVIGGNGGPPMLIFLRFLVGGLVGGDGSFGGFAFGLVPFVGVVLVFFEIYGVLTLGLWLDIW